MCQRHFTTRRNTYLQGVGERTLYWDKKKQLKHILNDMADQLIAVDYNTYQWPTTGITSIPSPLRKVEILHSGMLITSWLDQVIKETRHAGALKASVLKQTGYTTCTFDKVDFTAHKQAFTGTNSWSVSN